MPAASPNQSSCFAPCVFLLQRKPHGGTGRSAGCPMKAPLLVIVLGGLSSVWDFHSRSNNVNMWTSWLRCPSADSAGSDSAEHPTYCLFYVCVQIISQRKLSKALLRPGGTVGKAIITVSLTSSLTLPISLIPCRQSLLISPGALIFSLLDHTFAYFCHFPVVNRISSFSCRFVVSEERIKNAISRFISPEAFCWKISPSYDPLHLHQPETLH